MKKYLVLGVVIFWSALSALRADPAADLWAKVQAKYGTCKSFSCGGQREQEDAVGTENVINYDPRTKFLIRFQRPGLVRVDWKLVTQRGSVYTKDGNFIIAQHNAYGRQPKDEQVTSMDAALWKAAPFSMGVSVKIPALLLGEAERIYKGVPSLGDPVTMGEEECDTLVLTDEPERYQMTMAIDRKTQTILEMREYYQKGSVPSATAPYLLSAVWKFQDITFDELLMDEQFVYH